MITMTSIFLIYSGLLGFYYLFKGSLGESPVDILHFSLGGIVYIVCGVGFWLLKKWAVYLYAIFGLINQVVLLWLGRWNLFSLLFLGVVVYIGYTHLSEMS